MENLGNVPVHGTFHTPELASMHFSFAFPVHVATALPGNRLYSASAMGGARRVRYVPLSMMAIMSVLVRAGILVFGAGEKLNLSRSTVYHGNAVEGRNGVVAQGDVS